MKNWKGIWKKLWLVAGGHPLWIIIKLLTWRLGRKVKKRFFKFCKGLKMIVLWAALAIEEMSKKQLVDSLKKFLFPLVSPLQEKLATQLSTSSWCSALFSFNLPHCPFQMHRPLICSSTMRFFFFFFFFWVLFCSGK